MSTATINPLSSFVRHAPTVFATRTCRETLRVMFQHPESKCIVVCNATSEPLGLLMSERFFLKATGRSGMDLFYKEPVMRLMNKNTLIFELSTPIESVLSAAMNRPDTLKKDSVIVTRNGKFVGVVEPSDLLHL